MSKEKTFGGAGRIVSLKESCDPEEADEMVTQEEDSKRGGLGPEQISAIARKFQQLQQGMAKSNGSEPSSALVAPETQKMTAGNLEKVREKINKIITRPETQSKKSSKQRQEMIDSDIKGLWPRSVNTKEVIELQESESVSVNKEQTSESSQKGGEIVLPDLPVSSRTSWKAKALQQNPKEAQFRQDFLAQRNAAQNTEADYGQPLKKQGTAKSAQKRPRKQPPVNLAEKYKIGHFEPMPETLDFVRDKKTAQSNLGDYIKSGPGKTPFSVYGEIKELKKPEVQRQDREEKFQWDSQHSAKKGSKKSTAAPKKPFIVPQAPSLPKQPQSTQQFGQNVDEFVTRRLRKNGEPMDLGVCSLEEVVEQCMMRGVISRQIFMEFVSLHKEETDLEFIEVLMERGIEQWDFMRHKITIVDHRRLSQLLMKLFPNEYRVGRPMALDHSINQFLHSLYTLEAGDYKVMLQNIDKQSQLPMWTTIELKYKFKPDLSARSSLPVVTAPSVHPHPPPKAPKRPYNKKSCSPVKPNPGFRSWKQFQEQNKSDSELSSQDEPVKRKKSLFYPPGKPKQGR